MLRTRGDRPVRLCSDRVAHRRSRLAAPVLIAALPLLLAGCGGGSSSDSTGTGISDTPSAPLPPTKVEAFRLLNQTTFGATEQEAQAVINLGIEEWIDQQMLQPESLQLPYLRALPVPDALYDLHMDRIDIWFRNVLHGPDQLRQRVAFALSEVLVVSQFGALGLMPYGLADYYDLLVKNAFGNYRELIEEVTLHPAMGVYLSMLGNQKPDAARNISPDENYARELMQLFTIGLVELQLDGIPRRDDQGRAIPTYDQDIIEGFAHVFTGWHYANGANFYSARLNHFNQTLPMQLYPSFHATGSKRLLNGVHLPANQTGLEDLEDALDNLFAHDNLAPFISFRLIQRLVTSNPSPEYVSRVAGVFNNNGQGVRGDLGAVVKAILLDAEARTSNSETSGKLKEPILRLTQLWRAYDGRSANDQYRYWPVGVFSQGPLLAPSVFNFFSPFYAPPGEISDAGLTAPELQIATEFQNVLVTNHYFFQTFWGHSKNPDLKESDIHIDLEEEEALSDDPEALIDLVDDKLLAGQMSPTLRTEIRNLLDQQPNIGPTLRAATVVFFVASSPEFARQH